MPDLASPWFGFDVPNSAAKARARFFDPFQDMASQALPRTIADALRWSTRVYVAAPDFREALRRVVAHFLTELEIDVPPGASKEVGADERRKYKETLEAPGLDLYGKLGEVGDNYLHTGICALSVMVPIRRYLRCPKKGCAHEVPFKTFAEQKAYNFSWVNYEFHGTCPQCGYRGRWRRRDRELTGEENLWIKIWNPLELEIIDNPVGKTKQYYWQPPERLKGAIRRGIPMALEETPWPVIQAIRDNGKILFNDKHLLVATDPAIATIDLCGWGLSKSLLNFRQIWNYQILNRSIEEIASDFILPFRVLTPAARQGAGQSGPVQDPIFATDMAFSTGMVADMVREHRMDPTAISILPFPVEPQTIGGEAANLVPHELLEFSQTNMLNAAGVPAELYRGTLAAQSMPGTLRLFEKHWSHLAALLNRVVAFIADRFARLLSWEAVRVRLRPPQTVDDIQKMLAKLQWYPQNLMSGHTAMSLLGENWEREQRQMLDEQQFVAELQRKLQEREAKRQQWGAMSQPQQPGAAPGGDPNAAAAPSALGGGGGGGQTQQGGGQPDDLLAQADQIAQELLPMQESERRSYLSDLRRQNQALHHLVRARMEEQRDRLGSQGREQQIQQMASGKQAAAAQAPRPRPRIPGAFACSLGRVSAA